MIKTHLSLVLVDSFFAIHKTEEINMKVKEVTILILIDGFLQSVEELTIALLCAMSQSLF